MNYVKSSIPNRVICYTGSSFADPNWSAKDILKDEFEGDYDSLENFDAPGKPWDPSLIVEPTAEEKLAAAGLTVDELKQLLGL
jgi:hypothetical protein